MRKAAIWLFVGGIVAGLMSMGGAASADTSTVFDEKGPALQKPAYQLTRGTFTYTADRTAFRAKIKRVSKARTWVGAHVLYPNGSQVSFRTFYRFGAEKVTTATYFAKNGNQVGLTATSRWDTKRDTVTIILNNKTQDPRPDNERAALDLYTVTKGWLHGPLCGINADGTVKKCNDDYVSTRLRR
ncbi:MAG TPA: hypothetical protein VFO49_08040 [Nocardioides sp.]|nr:hypothetical protein [Nocardioides sp.]